MRLPKSLVSARQQYAERAAYYRLSICLSNGWIINNSWR